MLRIARVCGQEQKTEEPSFSCLFFVWRMQKDWELWQAAEEGILQRFGQ